uniref:Uncharacterized protein n=1 Tax=Timema poppense TaxID=170557 RepID=A0A7R9DEI3_TIMPO|nr:unnamed protein product [Timema poppensis]
MYTNTHEQHPQPNDRTTDKQRGAPDRRHAGWVACRYSVSPQLGSTLQTHSFHISHNEHKYLIVLHRVRCACLNPIERRRKTKEDPIELVHLVLQATRQSSENLVKHYLYYLQVVMTSATNKYYDHTSEPASLDISSVGSFGVSLTLCRDKAGGNC